MRDKQHGPVIELNRIQVKKARTKSGLAGPDGLKSVFGQIVTKMHLLTQESLFLPHRVWKVKFVGTSLLFYVTTFPHPVGDHCIGCVCPAEDAICVT